MAEIGALRHKTAKHNKKEHIIYASNIPKTWHQNEVVDHCFRGKNPLWQKASILGRVLSYLESWKVVDILQLLSYIRIFQRCCERLRAAATSLFTSISERSRPPEIDNISFVWLSVTVHKNEFFCNSSSEKRHVRLKMAPL